MKTYRNTAAKTSTEAWELLNDENWKIIKLNIDDDVISSLTLTGENRKIYKISVRVLDKIGLLYGFNSAFFL